MADEIAIIEEYRLSRNRLYTGLIWDVNERLDVGFFYYFQKNKATSDGWKDYNIIGAELKFSF